MGVVNNMKAPDSAMRIMLVGRTDAHNECRRCR
jgi:hypothetical protein